MKHLLLLLSSLALILVLSPAVVAADEDPVLPGFADASSADPALVDVDDLSASIEWAATSCQITRDCGDGNTVQCSGVSSCTISQKGVTCDGQEVACPNYCQIGINCSECGRVSSCWSTAGDCMFVEDGISCRGITRTCTQICRFF